MLLSIQHRDQNVDVGKQILQPFPAADSDGVVEAVAPFREALVERVSLGAYGIAERLEQRTDERLAAAAGRDCDYRRPVERRIREFLAFLASAAHGRPVDARHSDAQK